MIKKIDANEILERDFNEIFSLTGKISSSSPIKYVHYAAVVKHPRIPNEFAIEVGGEFDRGFYIKKFLDKEDPTCLNNCGIEKDLVSKLKELKIKGKDKNKIIKSKNIKKIFKILEKNNYSLTESEREQLSFEPEDFSKFAEDEIFGLALDKELSDKMIEGDIFCKSSNEIIRSFSAHDNTTIKNPAVIEGGISISSRNASNREGTLAGMLNVTEDENWYAITNKHILQGDDKEIITPGNSPTGHVIGTVEDLKEDQNLDLAIIKLEKDKIRLGDYIQHNYFSLKENKNDPKLEIGMKVKKYGSKSGYKEGIILSTNATVRLGDKKLTNQLMCSSISEKGDSGSFLVSKDDEVIGLIFGENVNGHLSFANKFSDIKECLNYNGLTFKNFISKKTANI